MNPFKHPAIALACTAGFAATTASAASFTETVVASGTFGSASFTNASLTFQGSGSLPSGNGFGNSGTYSVALTSSTVSGLLDSGSTFSTTFSDPTDVFSNTAITTFGFNDNFGLDIANVLNTGVSSNLNSSVVATGGTGGNQGHGFATVGGLFTINSFTGAGTFTENAGTAVSAAPEPGAWALMLGGVGMLGAFLRMQQARRREDEVKGIATA